VRPAASSWLRRILERPYLVLGVFLALFILAAVTGRGTAQRLTAGGFELVDSPAAQVAARIHDMFGVREPDLVAVVEPTTDAGVAVALRKTVETLDADPRVDEARLLCDPNAIVDTPCVVTVALAGPASERSAAFDDVSELLHGAAPQVELGGELATQLWAQRLAEEDLLRAELVAIPAVAIALIIFFRGIVAAALPLGLGAFSIAAALALLSALTLVTPVSVFALNIVTFLGLGLAVDYALFMVQRFREELSAENRTPIDAALRTVATAGRTVVYSGVAVAACLLGLLFFPIVLVRSVAVGGAVVVLCTMLAAITLLPAAMVVLGPRIGRRRPRNTATGGWARWSAHVMAWPGTMTLLATIILLALAWPGLKVETAISDARIFPPGDEVRVVQERMTEDPKLAALGSRRHMILLSSDDAFTSPNSAGALYDAVQAYRETDGVLSVDALPTIVGAPDRQAFIGFMTNLSRMPEPARAELGRMLVDHHTLVLVASDRVPGSAAASEQLAELRAHTPAEVHAEFAGPLASGDEVRSALLARSIPALATILVVMFVIVVVGFGAIAVAVEAVVMTVLSFGASFGILVAIFQNGRFERLLGYESVGTTDPLVPIIAGAIVFGLSMDYELFLLSRIKEDFNRTGDPVGSVARGLQQTAGIVTSAAVVLVLVLIGFASARILFVKQLGVVMAVAVLLDATIVRALLVPATIRLIGRWNWWSPRFLQRGLAKLGIGIDER
jgi:uncharacterized membrane protein YdfJ with MMPL/SSD domain